MYKETNQSFLYLFLPFDSHTIAWYETSYLYPFQVFSWWVVFILFTLTDMIVILHTACICKWPEIMSIFPCVYDHTE